MSHGTQSASQRRTPPWAWAVGLILIGTALWASKLGSLDLTVYRAGSTLFLHHPELLYKGGLALEHGNSLPFTYPPFAAMIMVPLAVVPYWLAVAMNTALSVGLLYFVCRDLGPRLARVLPASWAPITTPIVLAGIACWMAPFRDSFVLGQVNIVMFSALYLACVHLGLGFWAGVAVGLGGGVKLTPLALGLVPLALNRWKMLAGMATGFLGSVLLMWATTPALSREYWLGALKDSSRVGSLDYFDNISFRGVLERLHLHSSGLWFLMALLLAGAMYVSLRALRDQLDTPAQLGLASLVMLVVSPISWSHHATWILAFVYALLLVAQRTGRLRRALTVMAGLFTVIMGFGFRPIEMQTKHYPEIMASLWWRLLVSLPDLLMIVSVGLVLAAALTAENRPPLFASLDRFRPARSRTGSRALHTSTPGAEPGTL